MKKTNCIMCVVMALSGFCHYKALAAGTPLPKSKTEEQQLLEQRELEDKATSPRPDTVSEVSVSDAEKATQEMPEDNTPRYKIVRIDISGNTQISTAKLLRNIPVVYNAARGGVSDSAFLYDFKILKEIVNNPGTPREVSARTIEGFTQYLLKIYQQQGCSGVYVSVPGKAFESGSEISQGILPIHVLEATVSDVSPDYYDVNNKPSEKTYLAPNFLKSWSPVQPGEMASSKKLNDYVNLLNQNPDRYVSAVVSRGSEPNSLSVNYRVYEANPWHFFVQVDNSGTKDIQWMPRFGVINTNLLGFDDKFTAIYQTPVDSAWGDQYAVYGSYDFPIWGPRLRLNIFGGYNEFDISGSENIDFLGRGSFAGTTLRYNLFQMDKWFFDLTGTVVYEESKVSPSLFPEYLTTCVHTTLWGYGAQIHKTDDMTDTTLGFNYLTTLDGSPRKDVVLARNSAQEDFSIYTFTGRHSRYLDKNKIQRLSTTGQWIITEDRVVPSRMTSFGGMYTVRGYDEYETVADGGVLASLQYEYDLVRYAAVQDYTSQDKTEKTKNYLRKFAPLVFMDYGRSTINHSLSSENHHTEMCSWGGGLITEIGKHFTGTVYYGYPLIATDKTHSGKGRVNVGIMVRW